jgi:hypothetical protein
MAGIGHPRHPRRGTRHAGESAHSGRTGSRKRRDFVSPSMRVIARPRWSTRDGAFLVVVSVRRHPWIPGGGDPGRVRSAPSRPRVEGPRRSRIIGPGGHAGPTLDCRRLVQPGRPRCPGGHRTVWQFVGADCSTRPVPPGSGGEIAGFVRSFGRAGRARLRVHVHSAPVPVPRPRPIRLGSYQLAAAGAEIDRLMNVCGAVEVAPNHDRDKALFGRGGGQRKSGCPSFRRTRSSAITTASACARRPFASLRANLSAISNRLSSRSRRRTDGFGSAPITVP